MAGLLLLALLFLLALLNSLFFPSSKLLPSLQEYCRFAISTRAGRKIMIATRFTTNYLPANLIKSCSAYLRPLLLASPKQEPSLPKPTNPTILNPLFSTFDADGDGFISPSELRSSLRRLGLGPSPEDLTALLRAADGDGDGLIDPAEFEALCASFGAEAEAGEDEDRGIREAFGVFDGDGDGLISAEELSLVLKTLGLGQGEGAEACRKMIAGVDLDGDGMVDFEEFRRMMRMGVDGGGKI